MLKRNDDVWWFEYSIDYQVFFVRSITIFFSDYVLLPYWSFSHFHQRKGHRASTISRKVDNTEPDILFSYERKITFVLCFLQMFRQFSC